MLCFGGNAQFPELLIQIMHVSGYAGFQDTEVMIFHFLCTEKGSSAEEQVAAGSVGCLVNKEVFLLRPYGGVDTGHCGVAQQMKDFDCLGAQSFHGA